MDEKSDSISEKIGDEGNKLAKGLILESGHFRSLLKSRFVQMVRIITTLSIIGIVIYVFLPNFVFIKSRSAVITANIISIEAPITGQIKRNLPDVGTELEKGQIISFIENLVVDQTPLSVAKSDLDGYQDQYNGLKEEYDKLEDLKKELESSFKKYQAAIIKNLKLQLEREEHRFSELQNVLESYKMDYDRKETLVQKGATSKADFDKVKFEKNRADEIAKQSYTTIKLLKQQIDSLKEGVFTHPDGRTEVPYQRQRFDEVAMKQSGLKAQMLEIKSQIDNRKTRFESESKRYNQLSQRNIISPTNGVVIRKLATENSQVSENQGIIDIIDCSRVYVDVTISQGYFEKIIPGQTVQVKLVGSDRPIKGTVVSVRGGALQPEKATNFIGLSMVDKSLDMQVFITIDEHDLKQTKGDFCHVGRNATVTF